MTEKKEIINTGLRGITVASTKICEVDGEKGKLIYRGYLIQDLARSASFEEVAYLLLFEALPTLEELRSFKESINKELNLQEGVFEALKASPADALPMDIMQAGTSLLALYDPDIRDRSQEAFVRMAIRLIAKMPCLLASWHRIRNGKDPVQPLPDLSLAANFLYMLTGKRPEQQIVDFFDTCLVLHAEHTFNASTFAAREVSSTKAHVYAACSAAIGALSGDLHGGANVRVMEMLKKIGSVDAVESYVKNELAEGRKIMGLGHAVYQTDDPRAGILSVMSKKMGEIAGETEWYDISVELEKKGKAAFLEKKGREIFVNVDFYSASLYYAMGIPIDFFSPVFAISRVAGWAAHILEEQFAQAAPKPMLYRPKSRYIGDYCGPDVCEFKPIDQRNG